MFRPSLGLCITVFLVALDNTIIATAIPKITDEFHSLDDVGWYGSGKSQTTFSEAFSLTTLSLPAYHGRFHTPLRKIVLHFSLEDCLPSCYRSL
jgi:hypothetical protein